MTEVGEKVCSATKKVKSREDKGFEDEVVMEDVVGPEKQLSFREALLNEQGYTGEDDMYGDELSDEDLPENRWYKEVVEPEEGLVLKGAIPEILVSDEELKKWCTSWNRTLIVNVLGKKVNYRALENKLNRDWARAGKIKIIDMPRGYYAVQFEKDADYANALCEGPWMVADHYILVQRWRRNFLKRASVEQKVAVWVRIPELSLELYNDVFLKRLGNSLGSMLKIDKLTSIHSRGQFARICVEVDLARPVVPQVLVRGETLNLEYEGLHTICFFCGVYGHRESVCILKQEAAEAQKNMLNTVEKSLVAENGQEISIVVQVNNGEEGDKGDGGHRISEKQVNNSCQERVGMEEKEYTSVCDDDIKPRFGPWMVVTKPRRSRKSLAAMGKKKV